MVGDGRSANSGARMDMGQAAQLMWGGAGRRDGQGDSESLSLETVNNRRGSCPCCLGCDPA